MRYDDESRHRLRNLASLATRETLPLDDATLAAVDATLAVLTGLDAAPPAHGVHASEQRLRARLQLGAACRLAFDWRSPALAQSAVLGIGDVGSLGSGVNYARYAQPGIESLERALARQLDLDEQSSTLLVTSSGMGALAVLLGVLRLTGRLRRVLVSCGTYFEAREALSIFTPDEVLVCGVNRSEILATARKWRPDVVMADPLSNGPEQRMTDIRALSAEFAGDPDGPLLLVDGTMVPLPDVWAALAPHAERVMFYESCSKYRQMGLDLALTGMLVVPRTLEPQARKVRQSLGAIVDRYACELMPQVTGPVIAARFRQMQRAASTVASVLSRTRPPRWTIQHLSLPDHPDHKLARRAGVVGACIVITPTGGASRQRAVDDLARVAVAAAAQAGVPLVHGESFGFTASRLSTTSATTDYPVAFARLCVGPVTEAEARLLAAVLVDALRST